MRYLSVFIPKQPTKPIVVVDLNKPDRVSIIDAIYYTDFHGGHAFISNYKNVFTAKFDRRADTGEIKLYDIPKRIKGQELLAKLEALQTRGKDKKPRTMHPNSLSNLRPAEPFSCNNYRHKQCKLTTEQVNQAAHLKAQGWSWRMVGDKFEVKADTVRKSVKNRGAKRQIGS
jgi:hypothetical protein